MRVALISLTLLNLCSAISITNRQACQYPTKNPLNGCPENTVLVGPGQQYSTVQSAILSLPNNTTPHHLLILPGNYTEQVNVTGQGPVYLFGQTRFANDQTKNVVNIIWRNATGAEVNSTIDNAYTSTLTVAPTFNASYTGSGPTGNPVPANTPFGNVDFRVYNVNFINDFRNYASGPALAVSISYANTGFYFCGFYSYQDTVSFAFVNKR
jgi:pectin methylesterase-like acyl-CoA thioesterase